MQQLVSRAISGDKKAESDLFRRLRVRFTYLAKIRIGREDAEDIAQDACATVLEKYAENVRAEEFSSWALGILRNKIGNYLQRKARRGELSIDSLEIDYFTTFQNISDPMLERQIVDCLKRMTIGKSRYVRILNLVHQGYRTDEICNRLDIKPNHFYVLLKRSREMLIRCLDGEGL